MLSYLKNHPRRIIRWEKLRSPRVSIAVSIGTAWGAGLAPLAPGTAGTLVGIPIHFFTSGMGEIPRAIIWTTLLAAGTWAAKVIDEEMGTQDNQNIVMDEVVGYGITAWTAGTDPKALIAAFLLFRFFDIAKLPPVRFIDLWSKNRAAASHNHARWFGGFGVMADDVAAGFQGLLCMWLLQYFGLLSG